MRSPERTHAVGERLVRDRERVVAGQVLAERDAARPRRREQRLEDVVDAADHIGAIGGASQDIVGRVGFHAVRARAGPHGRGAARAPGADRGRERRPARGMDGDVGAGARVAAREARRGARRGGDRRGGQPVVHAAGASERALLIGGHIDSVPNGGWLDGCLNVMAGVEVLRRLAEEGEPAVTVRLVNWADEEGARFGRSLFGSSAAAGSMADQDELRELHDADGSRCRTRSPSTASTSTARSRRGAQLETRSRLPRAPHRARPGARVAGPAARRRAGHVRRRAPPRHVAGPGGARRVDAHGRAARRARRRGEARARDPSHRASARAAAPSARPAASSASRASSRRSWRRLSSCSTSATSTPTRWRRCSPKRWRARERFAAEESIDVSLEKIWSIEPILFDPELLELCEEAIREVTPTSHRLPSGPLHDAAEVSRAGVPTVMLFCQSLRGLSHTKLEDTRRTTSSSRSRPSTGSRRRRSPG